MGIRLVCPQGHKLHVKAFLAGKRAICPHCGEKVLVPLADPGAPGPAAVSPASRSADFAAGPETTIDLADVPTKGLGTGGLGTGPTDRAATAPGQATPAVVPAATGTVPHAGAVHTGTVAVPALASAIPAAPPAAPPPGGAASDPISENAGAVWYVRPKAGGQYGPAPGPMMRQWIADSRVAADSLVWREGWDQWRVARDVFVELGAGGLGAPGAATAVAPLPVGGLVTAAAAGPVVATSPAGSVATATAVRYHARRRSTGRLAALIVVLGLLVVALAAVFIYVVQTRM